MTEGNSREAVTPGDSMLITLQPESREAISSEIRYIRRLGAKKSTFLAAANLGAYEAVLQIVLNADDGVPVYKALDAVQSRFTSRSGILKRLHLLRDHGLLLSERGTKKSEVLLRPSEDLLEHLMPILRDKCDG